MRNIIDSIENFFKNLFGNAYTAIAFAVTQAFLYILRFAQFMCIYILPSFTIMYITLYIPKKESFMVLSVFAYLLALGLMVFSSYSFYRMVENNIKKYFRITLITYAITCALSFCLFIFADENLLLFSFTNAALRCLEFLVGKTLYSLILTHTIAIITICIVPLVLRNKDKIKAIQEHEQKLANESFDEMGMVFDPDELPDFPVDEESAVPNTEEAAEMLFDPDELPDPEEAVPENTVAYNNGFVNKKYFDKRKKIYEAYEDYEEAVLLFDPNERPEDVAANAQVNDEEENVGLLFDPDELPDVSIQPEEHGTDEDFAGLLFNPDELPDVPIQADEEITEDSEEFVGLLFDPDELPENNDEEEENTGLLFDPENPF